MSALDRVIPKARKLELDHVDLAAPAARVWERVRHGDLGQSPVVRALFNLRTLPARLTGSEAAPPMLRIDDLVSTPEKPGFGVLADDPPTELVVGAIGKVWQVDIPFVHVADAAAYESYAEPGYIKVAWALRVEARGEAQSRLTFELRVDATDDAAWRRFVPYYGLIGLPSRFIRRHLLASIAREVGSLDAQEETRALPGDELLGDAAAQVTHGVTIAAPPEKVWPWLVQMGCGRAGYYAIDALDNGGERSAREVHPELQTVAVGDVLPATPDGEDGFEVLRVEAPRALVLGGLYDRGDDAQLPFAAPRPVRYWHATWAFVLEPFGDGATRLHVRARVAFPPSERLHAAWMRPVHHLMEAAQLRHLAARAEGRVPRDDWRDVLEGLGGAAGMVAAMATPFRREDRSRWGVDEATAAQAFPGDDLVPSPRWSWTHGVEVDAPASRVWPLVAQIGADRGGFYSYQWLENLAGCEVRNAETVHPEWIDRAGGTLSVHPKAPPLKVADFVPGRHLLAHAPADEAARAAGRPWVAVTWLFHVEPLGEHRCRFISRYRAATSDDLATRLAYGPALLEPVSFTMDRRMLLGVKARAEKAERAARGARTRVDAAPPTV